ncbi:MAG TPA: hypothetical protein VFH17_03770 [Coriobacteriia bacterium]|nr:hypothetical protein [Coriobacteriia bacterium]
MAERGTYSSLPYAKAHLSIADTLDDVRLLRLLESASRQVDDDTGRHFHTVTATRYFTASDANGLLVPDLLSVSALHTDDGSRAYATTWATTDYELLASDSNPDAYPRWQVVTAPRGNHSFPKGLRRGARIAGVWGHGDGENAAPWATTAIAIIVDNQATTLTVAGGTLEAGQTILVDSEQIYMTSATTCERAVNGTTAAAHNGSAVKTARYPSGIVQATLARAEIDLRIPITGVSGGADIGTVTTGPAYARYRGIVEQYRLAGVA